LQRQQNDLSQVEAEVHRLVSLIHEATLGLRVIPLDIVFNRFPRMVREVAKEQSKQIRFEARADGIKVDKGMTELLADPLMHMLRNAVDHGIETPTERVAVNKPPLAHIRLSAEQHGNRIVIEIRDDGRGIDTERVRQRAVAQGLATDADSSKLSVDQINRFIFAPGFSTANKVSETSGRFRYGVEVTRILRRHEMLIRETHPRIAQLPGIGGVSTLGTDRIVLMVDPEGLTDLARRAIVPGMRVLSQTAE